MQTTAMQTTSNSNAGWTGNLQDLRSPLVVGLGALLAVQLFAALILGLGGSDLSPAESQGPLLAFEQDQITRLRIDAPDKAPLVLEKTAGTWQIPALGGFPATEIKVTDLLGKLAGIEKRIPVATSEAAIRRFKVAEEGFERHLVLEGANGPVAGIYLGDSPGFRRLFVRAEGEPAVYEAGLALFDVSANADDWAKKTVLQLEQDEIRGLEIGDIALTRGEDDAWTLDGLSEGEALDQEAVDDLVRKVANLDFRGILGTESKPEYGQDAPVLTLKIRSGDATLDYVLSKLAESDDHVLKVSNRPHYFRLSQYSVEDLAAVTRDTIVEGGEESPAATEDDPGATEQPAPAATGGAAGGSTAGEAVSGDGPAPAGVETQPTSGAVPASAPTAAATVQQDGGSAAERPPMPRAGDTHPDPIDANLAPETKPVAAE